MAGNKLGRRQEGKQRRVARNLVAVRGRFRAIAFLGAHGFAAANISSTLLQDVHLAKRSGPAGPALAAKEAGGRAQLMAGVNLSSQLKSL